jgi:hypothetical protein
MATVRLSRWLSRAAARLLVVALAFSAAGPLAHLREGHDADFEPFVVHDASQHRLGAPAAGDPVAADQHCAACHLVRVVRQTGLRATGEPPLEVAHLYVDRDRFAAHVPLDLQIPARAPPFLV